MQPILEPIADLMSRGGPIMWPLLALSVLSVAISIDRAIFWHRLNARAGTRQFVRFSEALRSGEVDRINGLADLDGSPLAQLARSLARSRGSEAVAVETVELQRPRLERYMAIRRA